MTFKQNRWWFDNMKNVHPQCTIVENDNVLEELTAEPQSTELSENNARKQEDEAEFQCPLCPRTYKLIQSVQNHCTTKHRWSYTKNCPIGETGTRGPMARSTFNPCGRAQYAAPPTPPSGSHSSWSMPTNVWRLLTGGFCVACALNQWEGAHEGYVGGGGGGGGVYVWGDT